MGDTKAPIMSIATKNGDGGATRLIFGDTVSKADLQVEAYGTLDELNSFLGLARALCDDPQTKDWLETLQRHTFVLGAELATPAEKRDKLRERVSPALTAQLDAIVAEVEAMPGLLDDWALPGATGGGAAIDCARSIARRAERCVVRLRDADAALVSDELLRYMNRLSDVIWLLGRRYELRRGVNGALRV